MPLPRSNRVTAKDVAERADVSVATVSRALSGARAVDPSLKRKVLAISKELGYQPNPIAAALRRNTTQTVGFVVPDITNPFFPTLIQALEKGLRSEGIALLLANSNNDPKIEEQAIKSLAHRNVDALFISPCHRDLSRDTVESISSTLNLIQVDRFASPGVSYVGADQHGGVRQLVDHLRTHGYEEIGFVGAHDSEWPTHIRERAFRDVAGPISGQRVLNCDHTISAGRAIGRNLPKIWPGVLGIVCANDLVAFGVKQGLAEAHAELEPSYTITGFDNTVLAEAGNFTSVHQPIDEIARGAVQHLISMSAERTTESDTSGDPTPGFIEMPTELIVRSSPTSH